MNKAVGAKLDAGDVRGGVRIVASSDTLAPNDESTYEALLHKHPQTEVFQALDTPNDTVCASTTSNFIKKAINSFPAGSAGGPTALYPQVLKDLTSDSNPADNSVILDSLCRFVNIVLQGNIPSEVKPYFFWGKPYCIEEKMWRYKTHCSRQYAKTSRC